MLEEDPAAIGASNLNRARNARVYGDEAAGVVPNSMVR